jgi:hypothetical protein
MDRRTEGDSFRSSSIELMFCQRLVFRLRYSWLEQPAPAHCGWKPQSRQVPTQIRRPDRALGIPAMTAFGCDRYVPGSRPVTGTINNPVKRKTKCCVCVSRSSRIVDGSSNGTTCDSLPSFRNTAEIVAANAAIISARLLSRIAVSRRHTSGGFWAICRWSTTHHSRFCLCIFCKARLLTS